MSPQPRVVHSSRLRGSIRALLAIGIFVLLAVVHTWPLASDPARLSRIDNADTALNAWIVSWIAHQLPRDPLALFDANIFHPERGTLAYSEPLIVPAVIGAPLRWAGASPILTYNLLLLAGFAFTALAMSHLVTVWTGDWIAGLLAGSLLAFNAHTLTRFPHLQAHHAQWLPLTCLALDRLLNMARWRDAVWLAGFIILLALTSGYLAVFAVIVVAVSLAVRPGAWARPHTRSVLARLAVSALIVLTMVGVVLAPYRTAFGDDERARPLGEAAFYAAHGVSYLSTISRFHYATWSQPFYESSSESLFPGLLPLALLMVALVPPGRTWRDDRRRMLVGMGIAGVVLSFGPATPVYRWLYALFPPMLGIRAAARFGYLALFAVAALAGFGLAQLRTKWAGQRWMTATAVSLVVLANLETFSAPRSFVPFEGFSPIYGAIARDPLPGAVVEFPVYLRENIHLNGPFVLASTVHWRPLINGYSGFTPESYARLAIELRTFPDPHTIRLLTDLSVSHVVVHTRAYLPEDLAILLPALAARPELTFAMDDDRGSRLYRLER